MRQLAPGQVNFDAALLKPKPTIASLPMPAPRGSGRFRGSPVVAQNQSQSGKLGPDNGHIQVTEQLALSPNDSDDPNAAGVTGHLTPGLDGDASKRPRACEACRGLKVRCDFPPEAERCKRCAKAKRQCIVTVPTRKRQRKTEYKVADLERRIDDLTGMLEEQRRQFRSGGASDHGKRNSMDDGDSRTVSSKGFATPHAPNLQAKKRKSSFISHVSSPSGMGFPPNMPAPAPGADGSNNSEYADVIDCGLLSAEEAAVIYDHYVHQMAKHLPAIIFPSRVTAGFIRKTKPVLFLAMLSVASGQHFAEKQKALTREVLKILAERVLCRGDKTLELVQAMQVLSTWHVPEDSKDTTTFQLIQLACSMAISMEINGTQTRGGLGFSLVNDKRSPVPQGPQELEQRRAWLSCFLLSGVISLPLRQLNMIRWSSHLEESTSILRTSPEGEPSDPTLCKWVDVQRIADRVAELSISVSSPEAKSKAIRQELNSILNKLKSLREGLEETADLSLSLHLCETDVHAHIIAMKAEDELGAAPSRRAAQAPLTVETPSTVSPAQAESIRRCINSIHQLLDRFASILERGHLSTNAERDANTANALPSFHFSRVAYGLVALIVLQFGATAPESRIAPALPHPSSDLAVSSILERLLDALRASGGDATRRPVHRFQLLVKMLRAWFERGRRPENLATAPKPTPTPGITTSPGRRPSARGGAARDPQPTAPERSTPRMGYRKLSIIRSSLIDPDAAAPAPLETSRRSVPSSQASAPGTSNPAHYPLSRSEPNSVPWPRESTAPDCGSADLRAAAPDWFAGSHLASTSASASYGTSIAPGAMVGYSTYGPLEASGSELPNDPVDQGEGQGMDWAPATGQEVGMMDTGTGVGVALEPALERAMGLGVGPEDALFEGLVEDFFGSMVGNGGGPDGGLWFGHDTNGI